MRAAYVSCTLALTAFLIPTVIRSSAWSRQQTPKGPILVKLIQPRYPPLAKANTKRNSHTRHLGAGRKSGNFRDAN